MTWTSVDERMPDVGKRILLRCQLDGIAMYDPSGEIPWKVEASDQVVICPTFWKELDLDSVDPEPQPQESPL